MGAQNVSELFCLIVQGLKIILTLFLILFLIQGLKIVLTLFLILFW